MSGRVVIGIDPHKASWTAAAVDAWLRVLATVRVEVNRDGYRRLRAFARRFESPQWAVEGAHGLGGPLVGRLAADGISAAEVPPKLSARVRLLWAGHGRKNDQADAVSVAIAALSSTSLHTADVDELTAALPAMTEHRDDLVRARTQTVNRLHVLLTALVPGGAPRSLTAETAAGLLRGVRARGLLARTHRRLAAELIGEIRRLDRRITAATEQISAVVAESGTGLTALPGIGELTAALIMARVGQVGRFATPAQFASYAGVAPIEVSSGDVVRHRLSRAGDRQLNYALHVMAITQIRYNTQGRAYYQRKRHAGKSHREALRALKRRLADLVYRQLLHDAEQPVQAGPGGHPGATLTSSTASPTPTADSSDKSLPGPATTKPTTRHRPTP